MRKTIKLTKHRIRIPVVTGSLYFAGSGWDRILENVLLSGSPPSIRGLKLVFEVVLHSLIEYRRLLQSEGRIVHSRNTFRRREVMQIFSQRFELRFCLLFLILFTFHSLGLTELVQFLSELLVLSV